MEDSSEDLDESDLMIVEEFNRIMDFYKQEKTFQVCDDEIFMDIFAFFLGRVSSWNQQFWLKKNSEMLLVMQENKKDNVNVNEGNKATETISEWLKTKLVHKLEANYQMLKYFMWNAL